MTEYWLMPLIGFTFDEQKLSIPEGEGAFVVEIAVDEDLKTRFRAYIANDDVDDDLRSFMLPLAEGVLGTSVDTGPDRNDPADDTVITPASAKSAATSSASSFSSPSR